MESTPHETIISHLIKLEDLNHHGTLFAGRMSEWMVEACFIAASRLVGRPEDVLCAEIHCMSFKKPATKGDIIEIRTRVAYLGTTSITVYGEASTGKDRLPAVISVMTFVTVEPQGKPYAHGMTLSERYIAGNKRIHEEAVKVRRAKACTNPS